MKKTLENILMLSKEEAENFRLMPEFSISIEEELNESLMIIIELISKFEINELNILA